MVESIASEKATVMAMMEANWSPSPVATRRAPVAKMGNREGSTLAALFGWSEDEFLRRTEGSPIRRIGHERWLRNIAVAMGNALRAADDPAIREALAARRGHPSGLVREHVEWALALAAGTRAGPAPVAGSSSSAP